MGFSKTLNFSYKNLGKGGWLIFTFDDQKIKNHEMYKDYYPVVWRIAYLQESGEYQFSEAYEQQFMLATSQIQNDKVTISGALTDIDFTEISALTPDKPVGYKWSTPVEGAPANTFDGINQTGKLQGITVGLRKQKNINQIIEPLLYLDVPDKATLQVEFAARLRIYAVTGLTEGSVINTQITSDKLWDHQLGEQGLTDDWTITYNPDTGNYEFTPDDKLAQ
ncbi:hypothetical protein OG21DRAFT_1505251 [Imleria badia]|nr:hypothetical protein OG21DRAFT_1505251 [Imleria badia]